MRRAISNTLGILLALFLAYAGSTEIVKTPGLLLDWTLYLLGVE